ncbi:MAG: sulfotransferase [Actinomycetota bacterium]
MSGDRGCLPPVAGGIVDRLLAGVFMDLGGDHRDAVFVAGSGRSGTSWLADLINHRRDHRYVFEPFDPRRVKLCGHFRSRQYLRPEDRREEYLAPARRILSGGLRSRWTDRFHRTFVARRRVIKDIRANLLLGWLHRNFPGMPIVFLLRHPVAAVLSQISLGWRDVLDETLEQRELLEDFSLPLEEMHAARDPFERRLFLWCVENYVPLRQLGVEGACVVFYENLVLRPERELRRLFACLGRDFDGRVLDCLERPSPLSRRRSWLAARDPGAWRREISGARLDRAVEVLALFGLDGIYAGDPEPDAAGLQALGSRA